ncbi:MAG: hypothetical protein APR62_10355 [Smithella sp. SDB]|nr:MAG: hypothetical protein APR62_10355 [Smithella sp. SDB]
MTAKTAFAKPLIRSRLHEEIVTIIQKQIMNSTITPGSKLPSEREMAETFSVNRATVREALRKLENLDLIEIRHGNGLYVKDYLESGNLDLIKAAFDLDEGKEIILNILEARCHIVPQMAYIAAQRRTSSELEEIHKTVLNEELSMLERDIKLHQLIARSTHNLLFTIFLNFFNQIFRDYGYLYFDNKKNAERSRKFHTDIYEAIKKKQATAAKRIMLEVLLYAEEAVKKSLAAGHRKE